MQGEGGHGEGAASHVGVARMHFVKGVIRPGGAGGAEGSDG